MIRSNLLIILGVIIFINCPPLFSADNKQNSEELYNQAMKYAAGYVEDQDLGMAFKLYRRAAELGHVHSMTNLAHHYYLGAGTEKNIEKSYEWFNTACSQSEPYACKALGAMYATGQYVDKSLITAMLKYQVSVDAGDPEAMLSLADILLSFESPTPKQKQRAIDLINQSAKLGHPPSIYRVGLMYYYGEIIERNLITALAWIDIASIMQEESAVKAKKLVKQYLTRSELKQANDLSREIRQLHFSEKFREL